MKTVICLSTAFLLTAASSHLVAGGPAQQSASGSRMVAAASNAKLDRWAKVVLLNAPYNVTGVSSVTSGPAVSTGTCYRTVNGRTTTYRFEIYWNNPDAAQPTARTVRIY